MFLKNFGVILLGTKLEDQTIIGVVNVVTLDGLDELRQLPGDDLIISDTAFANGLLLPNETKNLLL